MPEVKPFVSLESYTNEPEKLIFRAAKLCYGDDNEIEDLFHKKEVGSEDCKKMMSLLIEMEHFSPIEHPSYTFFIEGVSRAMTHELVRHRIASYSQRSQRYVNQENFNYIIPPSIKNSGLESRFLEMVSTVKSFYSELSQELSKKSGLTGENNYQDARYILPNACETKIMTTMNARELLHFFNLRLCNRAQWEIRGVAEMMLDLVYPTAPNVFRYAGPDCFSKGKCSQKKKTCGKMIDMNKKYLSKYGLTKEFY